MRKTYGRRLIDCRGGTGHESRQTRLWYDQQLTAKHLDAGSDCGENPPIQKMRGRYATFYR
jgi:hypothetical protein